MAQAKINTKAEKSARTKDRIIAAARIAFAQDGYAQASLNDIIAAAEVTTGAIYHHFGDKKGLFQAVAESLEQEILDEVSKRINAAKSPWEVFEAGIVETLEVCTRPDIQRIVFREAPTVIGLREWRDIEVKYAFGIMRATVRELAKNGLLTTSAPDMTAQILLGALMEAAHSVSEARNKKAALKSAKETMTAMLRALSTENL